MFRVLLLLLLISTVFIFSNMLYSSSAKKSKIQFVTSNKETVIESEGLTFRGLRDSKPAPSPSPHIIQLFSSDDKKFDSYNLHDMWMTDQLIGKWVNEAGAITIYKLKLPVPEGIYIHLNKFVLKPDYDAWLGKNKNAAENININDWMDFFAEGKVDGEPETVKTSLVLKILHYKLSGGRKNQDIYMVTDLRSSEQRTYLFVYDIESNADFKQSTNAIQQSVQSMGFQNARETEAKQMVTKIPKNKQEYSEEYYADHQRILNNIKNLKGWWFLDTAHYIIISNLKDRKLISDIEKNIEKARNAYKLIFPVKKPLNSVSVVKVFADREEYLSYLGRDSEFAWSAGFWDASKKELAISPMERGGSRAQELNKKLQEIMFHEAFHQYIYYATNDIHTAPWFNEGSASFFENLKILPGKENNFDVEFPTYMESFIELIKQQQIKVEEFLNIKTYTSFYDKATIETNYSMAWGLMYFLLKGAPGMKNKNNYSEIPSRYYDAVIETGDPNKATEIAWKNVDMKKFNEDFNTFWTTPAMISRSKAYNPFDKNKKKTK